jgi:hypothetical protein
VLEPVQRFETVLLVQNLKQISHAKSEPIIRNESVFVVSLENTILATDNMLNKVKRD